MCSSFVQEFSTLFSTSFLSLSPALFIIFIVISPRTTRQQRTNAHSLFMEEMNVVNKLMSFDSFCSEMALVNIMLLAGLGLDLIALKKLFCVIMRLTLIPTILEVAAITVCSHYLLNFPWLWGVLLGWVSTIVNFISHNESRNHNSLLNAFSVFSTKHLSCKQHR